MFWTIIMWLINSKIGRLAGLVGVAIMVILGAFLKGRSSGKASVNRRIRKERERVKEKRKEIDKVVNSMSDDAIRNELRTHVR